MKNLKLVLWGFIIWIIEIIFLRFIEIDGIAPNLIYVFVLCVSYRETEAKTYIPLSLICGILTEATSSKCVGFHLVLFTCSVFLLIFIKKIVYKEFFILIIPITIVFSFISNSLYYLLNNEFFWGLTYYTAVKNIILPVSLYNTVVSVIILFLLDRSIYKKKKIFRR